MSKIKMTKKELNRIYDYVVIGGYCEFQTLLRTPQAREIGYASGLYGWNWDAYEILADNGEYVCICTGYRDMTGKRIKGLDKYEKKARALWNWENKTPYDEKVKKHKRLLKQFANYIVKHYYDK